MKRMKGHEGARLGAAFGGRHVRREGTNERRTILIPFVRSCLLSERAARQSRAPNLAFGVLPPWIFMTFMVKKIYLVSLRYLMRCGWSAAAPRRRLRSAS